MFIWMQRLCLSLQSSRQKLYLKPLESQFNGGRLTNDNQKVYCYSPLFESPAFQRQGDISWLL